MTELPRARRPMSYGEPSDMEPCEGRQASPSNPTGASTRRLTETVVLRCTTTEKELLRSRAEASHSTTSELLRSALGFIKSARKRTAPKADPRLIVALNAIGSNLNQIARAINAARLAGDMRQLEAAKLFSALVSIDRELATLLASHSHSCAEASDAD